MAVLTILLFAMVLGWFVLIRTLFSRLERMHSQKYESMGRPSLFLRNNMSSGLATMKFLFAREHRSLNDRVLSRLSDFMLAYLVVYLVLFFGLFVLIPALPAPSS